MTVCLEVYVRPASVMLSFYGKLAGVMVSTTYTIRLGDGIESSRFDSWWWRYL